MDPQLLARLFAMRSAPRRARPKGPAPKATTDGNTRNGTLNSWGRNRPPKQPVSHKLNTLQRMHEVRQRGSLY